MQPLSGNPLIRANGHKVVYGNVKLNFNRASGSVFSQEINGTAFDIAGLISQFPNADEFTFEQNQETGKLTVTLIDSASETLELDFEEVTGSIFKNPYFVALSADRARAIKQCVDFAQVPNQTEADIAAMISGNPAAATANVPANMQKNLSALELQAYALLLLQVEDYPWDVPVLTWTRTVPRTYPTGLDVSFQGKVFATADLVKIIGAPILFSIPGTVYNVGVINNGLITANLGWRLRCKIDYLANGAIQLIENFKFGAYIVNPPLYFMA